MSRPLTPLSGPEFVRKLLAGERAFAGVRLEPFFDLAGDASYPALLAYLGGQDLKAQPVTLDGAELRGLDADGLRLPHLRAAGADFRHATLLSADLRGATLSGALFRHARLPQADLAGADLAGADFRQAVLNLARLTDATLDGADFAGADLLYADFRKADLKGIRNLEQARSVETANFQFVALGEREKRVIRNELWAQDGKKRRIFGGAG